jgi:hypothetical protein
MPVPSIESAPKSSKYSNLPGVFTRPTCTHFPIAVEV